MGISHMTNNILITVKNKYKSTKFSIDSQLFDNNIEMMLLEAATRFVEKYKNDKNFLKKFDPKFKCIINNEKGAVEYDVNAYYALINSGMYHRADLLREKIKQTSNIDICFIKKISKAKQTATETKDSV